MSAPSTNSNPSPARTTICTTQPTSSTSSDNDDDIPDLVSVFHDDSAPEARSNPSDDDPDDDTPLTVEDSSDDDDDLPPTSDDSDPEDDTPPTTGTTYDIRLATEESYSEHSSDEDAPDQSTTPRYWPIAEDHQPPPPADPSDAQIQAWITSRKPWTTFRHRLPILQCLAYGHRPPPAITRQDPNRSYMMDNSDESIDTVPLRERITDFRNSGHPTWTSYLNTLSTRLRQFYLDHPPNQVDFKPTAISALHVPDYDNSGTQAPYYEPKDPARPHPDDQKPTPLGGYTSTTRHISDVTHQQRGRSILSNPSRPQPETPVYPSVNQDSLLHPSHANGPTTPQSFKPPPGSDTVPPGTARLREILTNLRKPQTLPPPNPHNPRPEGYHTGHDPAQSSDSDNDHHPPGLTAATQIQDWIASQLPWSQYRQRLPTHQRLAYGDRSPPHIVRQAPNQEYLWAHHDDSIDNFRPAKRMAAFHTRNSPTWSEYLKTLPAHTRRAYLDHPPMPADYRPTHTSNPHKSAHPNDTTRTTNNELKGPARPHVADEGHQHKPPADHTSSSEGYKAHPRPATDPTPRKRF